MGMMAVFMSSHLPTALSMTSASPACGEEPQPQRIWTREERRGGGMRSPSTTLRARHSDSGAPLFTGPRGLSLPDDRTQYLLVRTLRTPDRVIWVQYEIIRRRTPFEGGATQVSCRKSVLSPLTIQNYKRGSSDTWSPGPRALSPKYFTRLVSMGIYQGVSLIRIALKSSWRGNPLG